MFLTRTKKYAVFNAVAFVMPGVIGCLALGLGMVAAGVKIDFSHRTGSPFTVYITQLLIGFIFLGLTVYWFKRRGRDEGGVKLPKWVQYIDEVKPYQALGLGIYEFFGHAVFTLAVVADIAVSHVGAINGAIVIAGFVLFGTLGMWIPLGMKLLGPKRYDAKLESLRQWLVHNTHAILIFEFGSLALLELTKGLWGFLY
jgi:hypothetical protein